MMKTPSETQVCVIDTTKDHVILLENNNTEVVLNTPLTEDELVTKQAQEAYLKLQLYK